MNKNTKQFANSIVFGTGNSILNFGNNLIKLGVVAAVSLTFVGQAVAGGSGHSQKSMYQTNYSNTDSPEQVEVGAHYEIQDRQTLADFKALKKSQGLCYTLTIEDTQGNISGNDDNLTVEPGFRYASVVPTSCLDETLTYRLNTSDLIQIRNTLLGLNNSDNKNKCFKSNGGATQRIGMVGDKCVNETNRPIRTSIPVTSNPEDLKEAALELNKLI